MPDDPRFLRRLQERDEKAFDELVRRHQGRVFGIAYRLLDNRAEAEDVSQEIFVRVFGAIGSFRGESSLSTWIYRIAVNQCRTRRTHLIRRRVDRTRQYEEVAEGPAPPRASAATRPDVIAEGNEMEAAVRRALADLDDEWREILVLRDVEGLDYEEIAQILGHPMGTVKSRLHRARLALQQKLAPYLGD